MSILAWIVVGAVAGWVARRVIPGEGPGGLVGDLLLGVVGAVVGGWIFGFFGRTGVTGVNIGSIIVAFVGAAVVLWVVRAVTRARPVRGA